MPWALDPRKKRAGIIALERIITAEAVGVWFELTGVFNVAGNSKVEQLTLGV